MMSTLDFMVLSNFTRTLFKEEIWRVIWKSIPAHTARHTVLINQVKQTKIICAGKTKFRSKNILEIYKIEVLASLMPNLF